ncbi:hypothetical protein M0R45_006693 [Rubus argutus]|uniref:Uncharacterized protein n=1 Tax=Rubus argutus TaxID=59490 RepID=A0AAW1YRW7_RUBAR
MSPCPALSPVRYPHTESLLSWRRHRQRRCSPYELLLPAASPTSFCHRHTKGEAAQTPICPSPVQSAMDPCSARVSFAVYPSSYCRPFLRHAHDPPL